MKWYLASRTRHVNKINSIQKLLIKYGHQIEFDWTSLGSLRPFEKNYLKCKEISQKMSEAISNSDIFTLISDKEGTDMFIELGMAIKNYEIQGKPKIYLVGKYNKRSLMHFHHSIKHVKSIEEVLSKECPELLINKNINF